MPVRMCGCNAYGVLPILLIPMGTTALIGSRTCGGYLQNLAEKYGQDYDTKLAFAPNPTIGSIVYPISIRKCLVSLIVPGGVCFEIWLEATTARAPTKPNGRTEFFALSFHTQLHRAVQYCTLLFSSSRRLSIARSCPMPLFP